MGTVGVPTRGQGDQGGCHVRGPGQISRENVQCSRCRLRAFHSIYLKSS